MVILTDTGKESAKIVAEHIRKSIHDLPVLVGENAINVSLSMGAAEFPSPLINNSDDLFREADNAMYRAKEAGKNRVVIA